MRRGLPQGPGAGVIHKKYDKTSAECARMGQFA
jgi:hypothetical protein